MKIALEARSLSAEASGVKTYVFELIRHMLKQVDPGDMTLLYDSDEPVATFSQADERVVPRSGDVGFQRWLHKQIPAILREVRPDVVHFTKADIPRTKVAPTVVTIFDTIPLLFPESQSFTRRLYWPRALKRAAREADHILTISDASRDDIVRLLDVPPKKITTTPLPVDSERFRPVTDVEKLARVRAKYGLPEAFVLFVSTRDKRKNIGSLIRAFEKIQGDVAYDLVIVGKPALKRDDSEQLVKSLGLEQRVHIVGLVEADELPALYSAAELFVFPSVYEGWSFPTLEAMACGTPVIVSNGGPLPQVVGEAGEIVEFAKERLQERVHSSPRQESLNDHLH